MLISRSWSIRNLACIYAFARGSCLPVQGVVLWPIHSSAGLHQSLCSGFGVGALEGCAPSSLPEWLADGYGVEGPPSWPSGPPSSVVLRPQDYCQLEKLGPRPFDSSSVPRHGSRHDPQTGVSSSRSSIVIQGGGHIVSSPPFSSSSYVSVATRPYVVAGTFSSWGMHSYATPPVADERPLVASGRWSSQPDPPVSGLCRSSQVVARRGQMEAGGSPSHSTPIPVVIYWRVPVWVGSSSSRPHRLGDVVRGRITGPHQHPGGVGCRTGPGVVSPPTSRTVSSWWATTHQLSLISGIRAAQYPSDCAKWPKSLPFGQNATQFIWRHGTSQAKRTSLRISWVVRTKSSQQNGPCCPLCSTGFAGSLDDLIWTYSQLGQTASSRFMFPWFQIC